MVYYPKLLPQLLAYSISVSSTSVTSDLSTVTVRNFSNPVLWADHPDLDVFRVGDVFYYSSSTFAFSPGAPVLKSYDLVHWEAVSHSVPELNFGAKYNLNGNGQAYVKGIWASSLRYRSSNDLFYWIGCIENSKTYIWTSPGNNATGNKGEVSNWSWSSHEPINTCYYDCGLLIDDDDTMFVAYGNTQISVAQLSADGKRQVTSKLVYTSTETIEGSRMYKINGTYYILVTRPAYAEFVLKSDSPWGPYRKRVLVDQTKGPLTNAGYAHQGGLVNTRENKWYYIAFLDAYPGGRIPVVAPITWTSDGWPELVTVNDEWGKIYTVPVETNKTTALLTQTDLFNGLQLSHEWEWNHNPDKTKWHLSDGPERGLTLQTADITKDLFAARNTLTRRIIGPKSIGTFRVNITNMHDGDRVGAVLFRDRAAYIGVWNNNKSSTLVMVDNLTLSEGGWQTTGIGRVAATGPVISPQVTDLWLRIHADITPAFGSNQERKGSFSYSLDGVIYTKLGPEFSMSNSWRFFTGYRYGIFNHATKGLGGQVTIKGFEMEIVD
jgi:beta-xylosidase